MGRWWWSVEMWVVFFFFFFFFFPLLLAAAASHHENPATDLVGIFNKNRTAQKLPQLRDNPGLGCMALQYIEFCKENCTGGTTSVSCNPSEDDFTEVFAPNCGVELPTFGTITGHIVGCHKSNNLEPSLAFSQVLVTDNKTLSLVRNASNTEIGIGTAGFRHKGGLFFWAVLFSDGQTNSTFVLEDHGEGLKQKRGCSSGSSLACNHGHMTSSTSLGNILILVFLVVFLLQGSRFY